MKAAMTALAVLLLLPASALAQERPHGRGEGGWRHQQDGGGDRGDRGGRRDDGEHRQFRGEDNDGGGRQRPQQVAPQAPTAAPAPAAQPPRVRNYSGDGRRRGDDGPRVERQGDSIGRPGPWVQNNRGYRGGQDRADQNRGDRGDTRHSDSRRDGDRRDWDRRDDSRRDGDRRDWDRRDGDRRDWGDNRRWDGDRRWDNDRRWDGRRDHPRWERGRYPSVYRSVHRYRSAWYPPRGYYVRVWAFGDFLPNGWFGPQYWIADPWAYDLPLPPPGYEWVRVGEDALLVDQWSGRIVQVVRGVFW